MDIFVEAPDMKISDDPAVALIIKSLSRCIGLRLVEASLRLGENKNRRL